MAAKAKLQGIVIVGRPCPATRAIVLISSLARRRPDSLFSLSVS